MKKTFKKLVKNLINNKNIMTEERKKDFFGTCVENPFETLEELENIIDNGEEITLREFIKKCDVEKNIIEEMIIYGEPSYRYYKNGEIYFYVWSAIEHFYK